VIASLLQRVVLMACLALASCTPETETHNAADSIGAALYAAPEFEGIDQYGETFSATSLRGKVWVASFMFTTCQSVCPALNSVQRTLQDLYAKRGVHFVSITTDPESDTPDVLRAYATEYDAKPGVWHFVTMPLDVVRKVSTQGFKVMDPESPEMHSTRFVLIDAQGQIRGYYDSEDSEAIRVMKTHLDQLTAGENL